MPHYLICAEMNVTDAKSYMQLGNISPAVRFRCFTEMNTYYVLYLKTTIQQASTNTAQASKIVSFKYCSTFLNLSLQTLHRFLLKLVS